MLISYITYSDTYYYLQVANCGILFLITIIFSYHLGKPRKKKENGNIIWSRLRLEKSVSKK